MSTWDSETKVQNLSKPSADLGVSKDCALPYSQHQLGFDVFSKQYVP